MDSRGVLARFEAERQALALMDHPNIAKVLDAGTTADGRPFFVMELVAGHPLTDYCDARRLTVRRRLDLFVQVCQAVQHAHQKGVMHRDLKPSNILVAEVDGRPMPKVIDFGLAKALQAGTLPDVSLDRSSGAVVGTPRYMAPEQADPAAADVDTRADVYALGVVLYELLVGSTPLSPETARQADRGEVLRLVREGETPPPTVRLRTTPDLPGIAAVRGTEPARLAREVRGDLEWIALRCLEKDRTRRYETASGVAADVRRYLAHEPVLAGPPSRWYRLRKFARRHQAVLGVGTAFAVLLVAAAATATWLAFRATAAERAANAEADKARAARTRTRSALDDVSSEAVATLLTRQAELTEQHRAFLRRTLERYAEFADDPDPDPAARADVARAYSRMANIRLTLGELPEARRTIDRAAELFAALADEFPDDPAYRAELARALTDQGIVCDQQMRRTEAEACFRRANDLYTALAAAHPDNTTYKLGEANTLVSVANLLADRHARPEAEAAYRKAIRFLEPLPDAPDGSTRSRLANAHYNLARLLREMNRSPESEDEYRRAITIGEQLVKDLPHAHDYARRLSSAMISLSSVVASRKAWDDAEKLIRSGLEIQDRLATDYPSIPEYRKFLGRTLSTLAEMLEDQEKFDAAREAFERCVRVRQLLVRQYPGTPEYARDLASIYNNFANFEVFLGNTAAGEAGFRKALEIQEPLVGTYPDVPEYRHEITNSYYNLGNLLAQRGDYEEAERTFRRGLEHREVLAKRFPDEPEHEVYRGRFTGGIAQSLADRGKREESLEWFTRSLGHLTGALTRMKEADPEDQSVLFDNTILYADALEALGRAKEALPAFDDALRLAGEKEPDPAFARQVFGIRVRMCQLRGDAAGCRAAVGKIEALRKTDAESLYQLACYTARLSATVRAADATPAGARQADADADRAMALVEQAVAAGYRDARLAQNPALEPLRARPGFAALAATARIPTAPPPRPAGKK
jgi:serine/threonine protein kinase